MFDLLKIPGEGLGNTGLHNTEDIAFKWIEVLFSMGANTGFGAAFATFTSMLGLLGGLFVGWHIIMGIVSSAYSGKVLGERYHQIWAPLRVVLGFGLMIPIAGGFSSVHYVLKDVIGRAAINMGNAPIVAYIDHLAANGGDVNVTSLAGKTLVRDIIDREVCVAVRNAIYNNSSWGWTGPIALPVGGLEKSDTFQISTLWDYGNCGAIMYQTKFSKVLTGNVGLGHDESKALREDVLKNFHTERAKLTNNMIAKIRGSTNDNPGSSFIDYKRIGEYFAKHSYSKPEDGNTADLTLALVQEGIVPNNMGKDMLEAADVWDNAVSKIATEVYSNQSQDAKSRLSERILKYGFMMAGSYERSLSRISGMTSELANATPLKSVPNPGSSYVEAVNAATAAVYAGRMLDANALMANGNAVAGDGGDAMSVLIGQVFPNQSDMRMGIGNMSGDPIGQMIAFGHLLLTIAVTAIIAIGVGYGVADGAAGNVVASFFGAAGLAGVYNYLAGWVSYIVLIMLIVGVLHAYVLPMLPMIMVFVMGVSWLIMFLEAAIAGVLWAFAFIRMDGQDFFDKNQAPGVTLLFNLFLRPAIGMLAFIGGLMLMPTLLNTLWVIWDDAFYSQTGPSSWIGLIQWVTGLIMFTWMQWHISLRLYGLIPTIADRVGHWMGFSGTHGYNDGQESTAAAGAMIAAGTAMAKAPITPQIMPKGGGGGAGPSGGGGGEGGEQSSVKNPTSGSKK